MTLRKAAFSAGRWTAVSTMLVAALQMIQTVILARILRPEEFGLMAITGVVLAVLSLITDFGLSRAIIHFDDLPQRILSSLYWLNFGLALLFMLGLIAAAPLMGAVYRSPELVPVLQLASLLFPLTAAGQQFRVLAEKALRFAVLARIEVVASVCGLCAAVGAAVANGGVYALVIGLLTRATVGSALAWAWLSSGHRPSWCLSLADTRKYRRFGAYLVGESLASTLHRDADVFFGGIVVGPMGMGPYSVPRELSMRLSAVVINPILTRVGMPIMSRVKGDSRQLAAIYLQILRMSASLNAPIYIGMGVFADELVTLLYGAQWEGAGIYLRLFSAWGLARSTANPVGSLLYATGRAKLAFVWNVALLFVLPPVYWLAARQVGSEGLAASLFGAQLALVLPVWHFLVRPCCGATLGDYMRQFVVPIGIALVAGALAWAATREVAAALLRVAVGSSVCGSAYIGLSWLFNRRWVNAVIEVVSPRRVGIT